jgi:DNA-binding NtrC family response regulator
MRKALVVDDEAIILWFFERALNKLGYLVEIARNIKEAQERLSKECFDIVITDLRMPGGNGTELIGKMGEITQKTKVIVCSAFVNSELSEILKERGIKVLHKPFKLDELEEFLETA